MNGVIGISAGMRSGVVGLPEKGAWVLLQEKDASNVTEVDLGNGTSGGHKGALSTNPFNAFFRDYKIVGSEVCDGSDSHIVFRWKVTGSSLMTSGYQTIASGRDSNNSLRVTNSTSYAYAFISGDGNVQAGTGYGGINFEMYIMNAMSDQRHTITGWSGYRTGNNGARVQHTQFTANQEGSGNNPIDYVRIWGASGNLTSGRLQLFGRVA